MTQEERLEAENQLRTAYSRDQKLIERLGKERQIPPKCQDPPKNGWQKQITCRRCGRGVTEATWRYCPNCGQAIMQASYAGTQGWDEIAAEMAWDELKKGAWDDCGGICKDREVSEREDHGQKQGGG